MKKQLKKSLSLLLTLVMVLGLLPTAALAATAITPTTPAGSGTSADPYRIGTAEELYGFAAIVNGGDTDAHLSSGAQALLIVAQYSGDQMTAVQILTVTTEGIFTPENPFTHADGCTYKAFLVDTDSCEPLCEATALIAQEK